MLNGFVVEYLYQRYWGLNMCGKSKVWLSLLLSYILITIVRTIFYGGGIEAFFVLLLFNILFWVFLLGFIITMIENRPNYGSKEAMNIKSNNRDGQDIKSDLSEADLMKMSEQE